VLNHPYERGWRAACNGEECPSDATAEYLNGFRDAILCEFAPRGTTVPIPRAPRLPLILPPAPRVACKVLDFFRGRS
jgi:hypothetical protein